MLPLTLSLWELAAAWLIPVIIGFLLAMAEGPYWIVAAIVSVFFAIVIALVAFVFAVSSSLLQANTLIWLGAVIAEYLISLVLSRVGFWVGEKV